MSEIKVGATRPPISYKTPASGTKSDAGAANAGTTAARRASIRRGAHTGPRELTGITGRIYPSDVLPRDAKCFIGPGDQSNGHWTQCRNTRSKDGGR
jgi:hypothetical protein